MKLTLTSPIARGDAITGPAGGRADAARYSEWHHFTFNDDRAGLHGIFNLALSGDVAAGGDAGHGAISLVVCERGRGWHGTMNLYPLEEVRVTPGRVDLAIGAHVVRLRGGAYHVRGALKDGSVTFAATYVPEASAVRLDNVGGLVSTFILPRLRVEGVVTLGGRRCELSGATGYHDHNWGHWDWGRDLGWDWGYVIGPPASGRRRGPPLTLVFGQVTDGSRATARSDLIVAAWEGDRCTQAYLDDAVQMSTAGRHPGEVPRVPGVLAMLDPAAPCVPRRVEVCAAEGGDRLQVALSVESAMQFLVPHPSGTGMTRISELMGEYAVQGTLGGRDVEFTCTGFAELAG